MTRKDFESQLFALNNNQPLGYRKTIEDYDNLKFIHLYYDANNKHLGTWVNKTKHFIFN
jgi:hypothetical protein